MTREEIADSFGMNAEIARTRLGYSQEKMAKKLGLSLSAYKRIINGETLRIEIHTVYQMYKLTKTFGCEICGKSNPYLDLFYKFNKLNSSQLRFINSMIDFELDFCEQLKADESIRDYVTLFIPTGNMQDGMLYDSSNTSKLNVAPYQSRYNGMIDFALKITSNHLHPVYHIDDILLISSQPIRDGDTGVFINKATGRLYIRKYYQTNPNQLKPLNGYGHIIYIDDTNEEEMNNWITLGLVITKMHT